MQPFEIFRPGKHTSASGTTLTFTEDDLRGAAAVYDPQLHEAPITVGHPKDNLPAYGWIRSINFDEAEGLRAEPHQVEEAFAELVQAGRFKKRSASFYTPDSPANPSPGSWYLRHVAFLGAQPPAIKGLKDVAFAEGEEGVVEFFETYETAGLFRRLREWMIGRFGTEDADKVIPSYVIEDLEAVARRELEAPPETPMPSPGFSESTNGATDMSHEQNPQNPPAATGTPTPPEDRSAEFAEREDALKAREEAIAKREREIARQALSAEFEEHATAGRLRPADVPALVEFAASLDEAQTIEFGEGDEAKTVSPREFLLGFVANLPKAIEYGEHGAGGGDPEPVDNETVANRARAYQTKLKAESGRTVSFTEAVAAVRAGSDQ